MDILVNAEADTNAEGERVEGQEDDVDGGPNVEEKVGNS